LICATPVRGRVLGAECLTAALGTDAVPEEAILVKGPSSPFGALTGAAFGLAVIATILPWSRFGMGSEVFGAWGRTIRWSILAGGAAVVGLALWLALRTLRPTPKPWMRAALGLLGGVVAAAALLAILHPPPFTRAWVGAWVAMAAGALACATAFARRWVGSGAQNPA
jgi:hypothetical protein